MDFDLYNALRGGLARNVKARRTSLKMTQEALAKAADVDRKRISLIEGGDANPTLEVLFRLATALDSSVDTLLRREV